MSTEDTDSVLKETLQTALKECHNIELFKRKVRENLIDRILTAAPEYFLSKILLQLDATVDRLYKELIDEDEFQ